MRPQPCRSRFAHDAPVLEFQGGHGAGKTLKQGAIGAGQVVPALHSDSVGRAGREGNTSGHDDDVTDDLAGIYREIERIEPIDRPGEAVRPRVERYPWPLGGALACGLLAVVLPRRRRA